MKALEWLIDRTGHTAVALIRQRSWWWRALGLALGAAALWSCVLLVCFWIVFGKKPHDDEGTTET